MASLDEFLVALFNVLGLGGALLALFAIFVVDAAIFPALPEVFVVLVYAYRPDSIDPFLWSVALLGIAVAGEAVGNTALYWAVRRALVDRGRMPRWIERGMRKWIQFLILPDERMILLNRVAPIVPFVGAFIATLRWSYRRSLAYIVVGGTAKYAALLFLVAYIGVVYDPDVARWVTFLLVVVIVAASAFTSFVVRRRRAGATTAPKP